MDVNEHQMLRSSIAEENMADIERISAQEARRKTEAGEALLVCAYEDDARCRMANLAGSISLTTFESRIGSVPKTQEVIFYCA
jgi:hypothetical protein